MAKLEILSAFRGYPDDQNERRFKKGEIVADLPEVYGDILIAKGLAQKAAVTPAPAAPLTPPATK